MRIILLLFGLLLLAATFLPHLDLAAAGMFYDPARGGFWVRDIWAAELLHEAIQYGSRLLAVVLLLMATLNRHRKAALFLLAALLIGPGLVTNTVFKDNWDRARPAQVQAFGGDKQFTPVWQPADQCEKNCSFPSGDGALGFFLHAFFYVAAAGRRRETFLWGFIGGGAIFGGLRIGMGAHFLSDVLWAGLLMLLTTALVHALFYGMNATKTAWRDLLKR
ncbi:MAG: phosphatase PAP2 family protein [Bdellovibrionales bacterium]